MRCNTERLGDSQLAGNRGMARKENMDRKVLVFFVKCRLEDPIFFLNSFCPLLFRFPLSSAPQATRQTPPWGRREGGAKGDRHEKDP